MSKAIATNHKARRDFEVVESQEAGIELRGSEVKSIREGKINLDDSYARVENNQVIVYNMHIAPYEQASYLNVDSTRPRKLLLHKREISKLMGQVNRKGFTMVPLSLYFNDRGFVKVQLSLCKGKKLYDKRADIRKRETDLGLRRALKSRRK